MSESLNNFTKALQFTFKWEGIWSNHPADPGGKTKYGITEQVYKQFFPNKRIEDATIEEAAVIYRANYWTATKCDDRPLPLAVVVFDSAVNCGPGRVLKWLEQTNDPKALIERRRQFYYDLIERNKGMAVFKNGWLNRINDLHKYVDVLVAEEGTPQAG